MPHVRAADGTRLYYEHHPGPAGASDVLLVMGLGLRGEIWGETRELLLERGFGVVTLDNRGVGASDAPRRPYGTRTMAADAVAVLDVLGIERAHLVGVSLGGMVAQELALARPERLAALALVSTSGGFPRLDYVPPAAVLSIATSLLNRARGATPEQRMRAGLAVMTSREYARGVDLSDPRLTVLLESMRGEASVAGFLGQVWASTTHAAWDRLARIAAPTLVQHGEEDGMLAPAAGRRLAERIPGARLELYPDAGHALSLQRPESLESLASFLRSHDPPPPEAETPTPPPRRASSALHADTGRGPPGPVRARPRPRPAPPPRPQSLPRFLAPPERGEPGR